MDKERIPAKILSVVPEFSKLKYPEAVILLTPLTNHVEFFRTNSAPIFLHPLSVARVSAEINGISLKFNETSPNLYRGEITLTDIRAGEYPLKIIARKEGYRSSRLEIPIRIIIMGDINYDNVVDYKDLAILGRTYGVTSMDPHFEGRADLNNDCIIDYKDLAILAANYGRRAS